MGELSTSLSIRHFDNDNVNFRRLPNALDGTLCTKRFNQNSLYGTKGFKNETERFRDGTKCFENKRNVLVTERNAFKV